MIKRQFSGGTKVREHWYDSEHDDIQHTWHLILNTTQGGVVPVSSTTGSALPRSSSSCSNISLSRRFSQKRETKPFALIQHSPASTHDPGLIMNYLNISPIPSLKDKYFKYFAPPQHFPLTSTQVWHRQRQRDSEGPHSQCEAHQKKILKPWTCNIRWVTSLQSQSATRQSGKSSRDLNDASSPCPSAMRPSTTAMTLRWRKARMFRSISDNGHLHCF